MHGGRCTKWLTTDGGDSWRLPHGPLRPPSRPCWLQAQLIGHSLQDEVVHSVQINERCKVVVLCDFEHLPEVYCDYDVWCRQSVVFAILVRCRMTEQDQAQCHGGKRYWAFSSLNFGLGVCRANREPSGAFE
jgi:hypothetical protein